MTITREQCLDKAKECVMKDRNSTYGSPEDSFQKVANLWEAYKGTPFTPKDVALMLALLKVGRLSANPTHDDSWIDLAGYAACGSELGSKKLSPEEILYESEEMFNALRIKLLNGINEDACKKISVMTEKERNLKGPYLKEEEEAFQKILDSINEGYYTDYVKNLLRDYRVQFPHFSPTCVLGSYQDIDAVVEAHRKELKID